MEEAISDWYSCITCFFVGLPEHWAERQGKIQERVERVQRETEAQGEHGSWQS